MPKLSANLSFLFPELPFLDRFAAAAATGFRAVEFAFAYDHPEARVAAAAKAAGVEGVLMNPPPGDWEAGEGGLAAVAGAGGGILGGPRPAGALARGAGGP